MKQLKSAPETTQFEDSRWFLAGDAVRAQICLLPQRPARSPKKPLRRAARSNKLKVSSLLARCRFIFFYPCQCFYSYKPGASPAVGGF
ncbi:hypothetical protein CDL15_Pgr003506 [Punica granatum]|uniref:Uncharacterized protein n=1 Tax=Punica granatum TaxID=22663 RepID=A0A218X324_PUNGR|nr:hypothetical protein CDL15_Pgr003506 [Punica granatum]